jgi:hypothetical protein
MKLSLVALVVTLVAINAPILAENSGSAVEGLTQMLNARKGGAHVGGVVPQPGGGYQVADVLPGGGVPRNRCATDRYEAPTSGGYGASSGYYGGR